MSVEERDRLARLRDAMDRRMSRRGIPTHRQLVQVFDGGSIPTTVPKMFLSHVVPIDVAEAEGATPSFTPDTAEEIPVLVLGPLVPVAGDKLVATVIGGRWVAEMQGGAAAEPCTGCDPCCVPNHDLLMSGSMPGGSLALHYVATAFTGSGTDALLHWYSDCFDWAGPTKARFVAGCNSANSFAVVRWIWPVATGCLLTSPTAWNVQQYIGFTCTPFALSLNDSGDPDDGYFTITDPLA